MEISNHSNIPEDELFMCNHKKNVRVKYEYKPKLYYARTTYPPYKNRHTIASIVTSSFYLLSKATMIDINYIQN